ncbi:hypothetical protein CCMSSC00406_0009277 [Pleurotus cornucopiae]|uniref:Uncharacterized protein n=1 Tax=Pleurotus cornucopiae TaxID=5321 RepID=A0ACB7J2F8_PLECO|nr:hypothetical protein CCMSSC00406_0009277 [Pleurotus cornucopiae]
MTSQFSAIARPPSTALSEGYYANESRPGSVTSQNSHCAPSLHRDLPPPSRPASVCSSVGSITSLPDSNSQASSSGWKPSEIRAWNDSDWTQGTPAAGRSGYGQPPTHSNHSSMSSFDLIDCPSVPSRQLNHTNSVPASFHLYILSFPEHSWMLVAQVTAHVSDVYQAEIATLRGAIQSALTRTALSEIQPASEEDLWLSAAEPNVPDIPLGPITLESIRVHSKSLKTRPCERPAKWHPGVLYHESEHKPFVYAGNESKVVLEHVLQLKTGVKVEPNVLTAVEGLARLLASVIFELKAPHASADANKRRGKHYYVQYFPSECRGAFAILKLACPAIGYCAGHYKASAAIQAALLKRLDQCLPPPAPPLPTFPDVLHNPPRQLALPSQHEPGVYINKGKGRALPMASPKRVVSKCDNSVFSPANNPRKRTRPRILQGDNDGSAASEDFSTQISAVHNSDDEDVGNTTIRPTNVASASPYLDLSDLTVPSEYARLKHYIETQLAIKIDALPPQLLAKTKVLVYTFGTNQQFKLSPAVDPNVSTLLTRIIRRGGVTLESALIDWSSVGSVQCAFNLIAAGLTICSSARFICCEQNIKVRIPMLADAYMEKLVDKLTLLWQKAGSDMSKIAAGHLSPAPRPRGVTRAIISSSPAPIIHSPQPLKLLNHHTTPLNSSLTFGPISLRPASPTPSPAPSSPPKGKTEDEDWDDATFRSLMQSLSISQYHNIVKTWHLTGCPKSNANKLTWIDFFTGLPLSDKYMVKCDAVAMPKTGRGTTKKIAAAGKKTIIEPTEPTITPTARKIASAASKLPIPRPKPRPIMPTKSSTPSSPLTDNDL